VTLKSGGYRHQPDGSAGFNRREFSRATHGMIEETARKTNLSPRMRSPSAQVAISRWSHCHRLHHMEDSCTVTSSGIREAVKTTAHAFVRKISQFGCSKCRASACAPVSSPAPPFSLPHCGARGSCVLSSPRHATAVEEEGQSLKPRLSWFVAADVAIYAQSKRRELARIEGDYGMVIFRPKEGLMAELRD
jgi:hypothetical protein